MKYKLYDTIQLITNKYVPIGVLKGTFGIIVEIYDEDNFEIEFIQNDAYPTGKVFPVKKEEIMLVDSSIIKSDLERYVKGNIQQNSKL
ncbi:hypothetical protein M2475_001820 [Breznakia sp. PF5-3]|uniref:DUF4926 domain-containing protein n=1 Tax=unclassified Breznakia TaxID=2623764 RepID=UPI002404D926|nr:MULTISPECIES: DUF4926 domain-containing protein [unclassified Breznakia]MDF9825365.1 hypothetical protein [Breznakia sp. PM6-1]MDF9836243.1 hypothetical protein [Breznakia sp. PF5-3]MDF9838517.1 hypothetical protein [Breznakia sp. PFB2-8]MDF9860488.1 hypothetical protein [Breznakia sp. PH5-24]